MSRARSKAERAPRTTAALVERLAALLEAGIPPASAWRHLETSCRETSDSALISAMAEALDVGHPGASVLSSGVDPDEPSIADEWRQLAAVWEICELSGSPMAACLRAHALATRAAIQARRDAEIALSGPRATSRLVLALPGVGLVLGWLMGLNTVGVLFGRPLGWFCLGAAAVLVVIARRWNARLLRRATPSSAVPGLELDLLATALSGGGSWAAARERVSAALARHCPVQSGETPGQDVTDIMLLSEQAGIPAASLLRSAADEKRRDAAARLAIAVERLGVALMLPLGVCVLPAFLLVGVVPLVVTLLSSTALGQ